MLSMPSELMLTLSLEGVTMIISATGLLFTEQFRVTSSPAVNVEFVALPLNCGAPENVEKD